MTITKDRRKCKNIEYDCTCIEIFDSDEVNKYFGIDKSYFNS